MIAPDTLMRADARSLSPTTIHQQVLSATNLFLEQTATFTALQLKPIERITLDDVALFAQKAANFLKKVAEKGEWNNKQTERKALLASGHLANIHLAIVDQNEVNLRLAAQQLADIQTDVSAK